jgi:putative FmdB family regulatory protein
MPIYEYACAGCRQTVSIFFRSISAVADHPVCPRCGSTNLRRAMSRVWVHSARSSSDPSHYTEPSFEESGVPFYGGDDSYLSDSEDSDFSGAADDDDVISAAREARAMSHMMGEPLDHEFDTALRHIEQGADPDDVFGEMDQREDTEQ